jgi:hypothetical protein
MSDAGLFMPDFGGGDTFSTYLYASRKHPDKKLQKRLFEATSEWVEEALPDYSTEDICEVISNEKGTVLEPFDLTSADIELASMLMRMAFSRVYLQTRFRIVSRETIGSDGGLVITNNLNSYYVERFAHGTNRTVPTDAWTFSPASEPSTREVTKLVRPKVKVSCRFADEGMLIDIKIPTLEAMNWASKNVAHDENLAPVPISQRGNTHSGLIRDLMTYSTIGSKKGSLEDLGLRIDLTENRIVIAPKSPESVVRLTAHLMKKSVLLLDPGPSCRGRMKLLIGLQPPAEPQVDLEYSTVFTEGVLRNWLNIEMDRGPYIEKGDRYKIFEWLTSKPTNNTFKEYQI